MTTRRRLVLSVWLSAPLVVLSACSGDGAGGGTYPAGTGGAAGGDCANLGAARGPSETCCPAFGIDACGAGLVCAALEGRTVPTCYVEGTQLGLEQCTVDALCISGDCEETVGLCKSLPSEACQDTVGCADPTGTFEHVICTGEPTSTGINPATLTCETPTQLGGACGYCETSVNCNSAGAGFQCTLGRCLGTAGTVVSSDAGNCCASGSTLVGGQRVCS